MVGGPTGGRHDDWGDGGNEWVRPIRSSRGAMPGGRPRQRGRGRRPGLSGARPIRLPTELPTWPTVLAVVTAVVLAFIIGRATGGGEEVDTERAASTTSTTTTTAPITHTVGRGESLAAIAAQFGVTTEALAEYNGITDLNRVNIGQVLQIPPATTTTVPRTTKTTTKTTKK